MCRVIICSLALLSLPNVCESLCEAGTPESCATDDLMSLLQVNRATLQRHENTADKNGFAFMHMPFSFGNTVEAAAMLDHIYYPREQVMKMLLWVGNGSWPNPAQPTPWDRVWPLVRKGGRVWGHFNPDLQVMSNITGCPMYLSPPKYWPKDIARKYIGNNKSIVGVLVDPYDKLVSNFRLAIPGYGGIDSGFQDPNWKACNLNVAVKAFLKKMKASGDMFQGDCANIPQSEYFEGEFGVNEPVDGWRFPTSMNEKFAEHGYPFNVRQDEIIHVGEGGHNECDDSWSYQFDEETHGLIREIYKKDFDLICKKFGHCDFSQSTCMQGVRRMCPETVFKWDDDKKIYCPKAGVDLKQMNIRVRDECGVAPRDSRMEESPGAKSGTTTHVPFVLAAFVTMWM